MINIHHRIIYNHLYLAIILRWFWYYKIYLLFYNLSSWISFFNDFDFLLLIYKLESCSYYCFNITSFVFYYSFLLIFYSFLLCLDSIYALKSTFWLYLVIFIREVLTATEVLLIDLTILEVIFYAIILIF